MLAVCQIQFVPLYDGAGLSTRLQLTVWLIDHDCTYDDKRTKPGMRPGAIESLTQRLSKSYHAIPCFVVPSLTCDAGSSYPRKYVPRPRRPLATGLEMSRQH